MHMFLRNWTLQTFYARRLNSVTNNILKTFSNKQTIKKILILYLPRILVLGVLGGFHDVAIRQRWRMIRMNSLIKQCFNEIKLNKISTTFQSSLLITTILLKISYMYMCSMKWNIEENVHVMLNDEVKKSTMRLRFLIVLSWLLQELN